MKKALLAAVLCVAMVFAFAACGDSGDKEAEKSEETATEETTEETTDESTGDYSDIAGSWTVQVVQGPDEEEYTVDEVDKLGMEPEQVQATLEIGDDGSVNYKLGEQELGGSSTFDGETLAVKFDNDYEMSFIYEPNTDMIVNVNEDSGISLCFVRDE